MNLILIGVLTAFLALGGPSDGAQGKRKLASEFFKLCNKKSPKFADCVKDSLETLKPQLSKGIPELNVLPIEPMVIPKLELVEGGDNFKFRQTLSNMTISGLSDFTTEDVKANISEWSMEMTLKMPFLSVTADYEMDGKILVIPISGKGDCAMNLTDVTATGRTKGNFVQRKGKEFMDVEDFKWNLEVEGFSCQYNNLFNGDKSLGTAVNLFLNENWKEVFDTYKSLPEEALGVLFKHLTNNVYDKFPTDEIFLD